MIAWGGSQPAIIISLAAKKFWVLAALVMTPSEVRLTTQAVRNAEVIFYLNLNPPPQPPLMNFPLFATVAHSVMAQRVFPLLFCNIAAPSLLEPLQL